MMDRFINNVGRGVIPSIQIMNNRILKGSPLFKQWYGRYALKGGLWHKLKLIIHNG